MPRLVLVCVLIGLIAHWIDPAGAQDLQNDRNGKASPSVSAVPVVKSGQPWLGVSRWWADQKEVVLCGVFKDGPAGRAGLQAGDVIESIASERVRNLQDYEQILSSLKSGDRARLEIRRFGETQVVLVKLEPLPKDGGVARFKAAAARGEAWAMCELGMRFAFMDRGSSFVEPDAAEGARWFQQALQTGDSTAPLFLGLLHAQGRGVPRDYDKARELLMQARRMKGEAVPAGIASAASNQLALMCLLGQGVPEDTTLALRFFRDAADQGSLAAMHRIGSMFEHGIGVTQDRPTVELWYRKAAEQGYEPAEEAFVRLGVTWNLLSGQAPEKKPAN